MANQNSGHRRCAPVPQPQRSDRNTISEPVMRRWPHPTGGTDPAAEPILHYIYCALSYQNQLLADIKTLVEQLALPCEAPAESSAEPTGSGPSVTMMKK